MKPITITATNGNTIRIEQLTPPGPDREQTAVVSVVDRVGELVSTWQGPLPGDLVETLAASEFRLVVRCEVCGSSFRAKRETATTCSHACRTKRWRRRLAAGHVGDPIPARYRVGEQREERERAAREAGS